MHHLWIPLYRNSLISSSCSNPSSFFYFVVNSVHFHTERRADSLSLERIVAGAAVRVIPALSVGGLYFGMRAGKYAGMQRSWDERFVFVSGADPRHRCQRNCFISDAFLPGWRPITAASHLTAAQPVITFILHLQQREARGRWSRCGFDSCMRSDWSGLWEVTRMHLEFRAALWPCS